MKKQLLACVLICGSVLAHAQEEKASNWRFMARAGTGFGGENMLSGNYRNGGYYELNAGSGMKYALGVDYRLAPKVTVQASIGREISMISAIEGDLTFTRLPLEVIGMYDISKDFRLGAGLRYSTEAKLRGTGVFTPLNDNFESVPGAVVEGQYIFSSTKDGAQFGLSLRYVTESFKGFGTTYRGEHGSLAFVLYY
jgi:hypothetical protein